VGVKKRKECVPTRCSNRGRSCKSGGKKEEEEKNKGQGSNEPNGGKRRVY